MDGKPRTTATGMKLPIILAFTLALALLSGPILADQGMLKIVTEPGDAKRYINGKRKGNSPA